MKSYRVLLASDYGRFTHEDKKLAWQQSLSAHFGEENFFFSYLE